MESNDYSKFMKCSRKVLPGLGGIKKNYLRKSWCLKKTLLFVVGKIKTIESSLEKDSKEKNLLNKICVDLQELSKYEKNNKIAFYSKCWSIINSYN
jgi:hypothetical protein